MLKKAFLNVSPLSRNEGNHLGLLHNSGLWNDGRDRHHPCTADNRIRKVISSFSARAIFILQSHKIACYTILSQKKSLSGQLTAECVIEGTIEDFPYSLEHSVRCLGFLQAFAFGVDKLFPNHCHLTVTSCCFLSVVTSFGNLINTAATSHLVFRLR